MRQFLTGGRIGVAVAGLALCFGPRPLLAQPVLDVVGIGTLEMVADEKETDVLDEVDGLAFDQFGNLFAALEITGSDGGVVYIDKDTGAVTPLVTGISRADQIAFDSNGDLFVTSEETPGSTTDRLYRLDITYNGSNVPISATKASITTTDTINNPEGLVVLETGQTFGTATAGDMFVAEDINTGRIMRVDLTAMTAGAATVLVDSGEALDRPEGMAFGDFNGALTPALYVAETGDDNVLQIDSSGNVSVFGTPGTVAGSIDPLESPDNLEFAVAPDGVFLFVTEDRSPPNGRVLRIDSTGAHSVFASGFDFPQGLAVDPITGYLYISEQGDSRIWRVEFVPEPAAGVMLAVGLMLAGRVRRRSA